MRKRNHTVTIRMNEKEYALLRQKMKESGQTQQAKKQIGSFEVLQPISTRLRTI